MADKFRKTGKIEWEPAPQDPINPANTQEQVLTEQFEETEDLTSRSAIVVEEYDRTIEFMKFVEGLLRNVSQVEVEINPEDDPEVWMAMQRIFTNPSPKLNSQSYFQVLDALEAINTVELAEEDPRNAAEDFLSNLPDVQSVDEAEIQDEEFQETALDEIEDKAKVRRSSPFAPIGKTDSGLPPETEVYKRRWRKLSKKIKVLGNLFTVLIIKKKAKIVSK